MFLPTQVMVCTFNIKKSAFCSVPVGIHEILDPTIVFWGNPNNLVLLSQRN